MRISDWSSDVCSSDRLWGCAFEDLLTRTIQPDRNIVDDYIRRRGWNESGPTQIYLRALRSSVMSLHEVSEVEPGSGFLVRDLIRGGEPLRVSERSASQTLKQRSEEHTSELQSLMRISYAVFCLKKKK